MKLKQESKVLKYFVYVYIAKKNIDNVSIKDFHNLREIEKNEI